MHFWGIPLTLAYITLFTWLITRLKHFGSQTVSRKLLVLFFFYKLVLGMTLTLIYTWYYADRSTADIYKYFDDSYHMTRALWENPVDYFKMLLGWGNDTQHFTDAYYSKMGHWFRHFEDQQYNDNHTIIRWNAVVRLFSGGYFHVHTVFMCFLSFWGIMSFYKGFALFIPARKNNLLVLLLFLFPSLNFWSAGVLKEGLLIFVLGNIFYAVCLFSTRQHKLWYYILAGFSLFVALYLKTYSLAVMFAGLSVVWLASLWQYKKLLLPLGIVVLGLALTPVLISLVKPEFHIPTFLAQKQLNFVRFSQEVKAGSMFSIGTLEPSWGSLLQLAPNAFVAGFIRPLPHETGSNPLMLLSALESALFILGIVAVFIWFEKNDKKTWSMVACAVLVVSMLSVIIGLSTVNFGSLVRYKIPYIPFLIFVFVALVNTDKIKTRFGRSVS